MAVGRRPDGSLDTDTWWRAKKGEVWRELMPYVERLERQQSETYDRFVKLDFLYDPYSPAGRLADGRRGEARDADGIMQENLIASNCDAISGSIASVEVKARFLTDGASWSMQRKARKLDHYAEALGKLLGFEDIGQDAFHAGSRKGTGLGKVHIDPFDQIVAEHVPVDDIVVDEGAVRGGKPRQMQHRMMLPREVLLAQYPDKKKVIEEAQRGTAGRQWRKWAGYRPVREDEVVVIESWRLPIGPKGHKGFVPGRHVICVDNGDLLDEPWEEDFFPFAVFRWTKRPDGWYGIGGAERILGHQRKLNKRNLQHDRIIDQYAFPIQYVRLADANISVKTVNRLGTVAFYKADVPKTVVPPSVPAESFKDREDTKSSGFEEFGQSRMAVSAMKPPGIDSGIAMREYRDQTTQRFAGQEKGYEQFRLQMAWLGIWCAKKLGAKAPVVTHQSRFGERRIKWSQVDMGDVKLMMEPASRLGRTPAGRTQFVMEMAQAGIISQDSSRRLLMPNAPLDVEAELSVYIEAAEDIDATIEEIEDGRELVPEPYQNMAMGVWRMQCAYLRDKRAGAPEHVLEGLRQWIEIADYELGLQEQEAANTNAMAPPMEAAPQAALAPEAMQLRAV